LPKSFIFIYTALVPGGISAAIEPEFTGCFHPPALCIQTSRARALKNQHSAQRPQKDAKEKVVILT
jgi:hypothetical protein